MTMRDDGYDIRKYYAHARPPRRRQRWSRWLLAGAVAMTVAWPVFATIFSDHVARHLPNVAFMATALIAASTSPFAREAWLSQRGLATYDEFERAALHRATWRAYLLLVTGLVVALLALAACLHLGATVAVTPPLLVTWAAALVGLGLTLPVLIAEWTVPMPDAEDQTL